MTRRPTRPPLWKWHCNLFRAAFRYMAVALPTCRCSGSMDVCWQTRRAKAWSTCASPESSWCHASLPVVGFWCITQHLVKHPASQ